MVEARVRRLPGYVELTESRRRGPGAKLRQYASRMLGDMQPLRGSDAVGPLLVHTMSISLHDCCCTAAKLGRCARQDAG